MLRLLLVAQLLCAMRWATGQLANLVVDGSFEVPSVQAECASGGGATSGGVCNECPVGLCDIDGILGPLPAWFAFPSAFSLSPRGYVGPTIVTSALYAKGSGGSVAMADGAQGLELCGPQGAGSPRSGISQSVILTAGLSYNLSFAYFADSYSAGQKAVMLTVSLGDWSASYTAVPPQLGGPNALRQRAPFTSR